MQEVYIKEKFALIFSKVDDKVVFETMTTVVPISIEGFDKVSFVVKSGKYSGLKEDSFNYLRGEKTFDDDTEKALLISDRTEDYKPSIYIFSNDYIDQLQTTKYLTKMEAYTYLSNLANNIELISTEDSDYSKLYNVLLTKRIDRGIANPYTPKVVEEILSSNVINVYDYLEKVLDVDNLVLTQAPLFSDLYEKNTGIKLYKPEDEEEWLDEDIDVKKVSCEVSEKIIGQEDAIKTLVTNIHYNQVLIDSLELEEKFDFGELDARKGTILVDGTTGTGKTAIVKEIASKLDLPIVISNANSFSETGYVGPTITDLLKRLLAKTNYNVRLAERGIIVLDEIDKIASDRERGHNQKRGVQEELLTFIGGGEYDIKLSDNRIAHFNTSKITFILMGAFTDIKDKKIKENESNKIGFDTDNNEKEKAYLLTPEDYIEYGIMREFFGRIKVIANTKTYTKEDLKKIILESKISPLKNFEKTVKLFGYDSISYEDDFVDRVVNEAYDMNTGARGLQTVISGVQDLLLYDIETGVYENEVIKLESTMIDEYKEKKKIKY